jgi:hypothetical protein
MRIRLKYTILAPSALRSIVAQCFCGRAADRVLRLRRTAQGFCAT